MLIMMPASFNDGGWSVYGCLAVREYDLDKVAIMITQTGGGCRATNYVILSVEPLKTPAWAIFQ